MSPHKTSILVVDDEEEIRLEINEFFTSRDFQVLEASTPSEAFRILAKHPAEIAILDIRLPEMSGIDMLKELRRIYPDLQSIMMSGHGDMDSVIQALRLGAVDYFQKPFRLVEMLQAIDKARKFINIHAHSTKDQNYFMQDPDLQGLTGSLIVVSAPMKRAVDKMRLVARSKDTTVLITGESGTGKELIAQGIHHLSTRKGKPFHAVNCSTIPDELFESEFFGYKKGAFTGADSDKAGWFEAADGGTLFLDEIGDMKMNLQAKLLRIMEDRQISRLGATTSKKIDVRVVAATNQDLVTLIRENKFRQDLYHRINTFVIDVPPLRERTESIQVLFAHYLEYYANKLERQVPKVDKEILEALRQYDFPGNVRELKHMVERALILCEGSILSFSHFDHLKIKMQKPSSAGKIYMNSLEDEFMEPSRTLDVIEKESIENALRETGNNKSQAARLLNISRQALDRKLEKLGIELNRQISGG
jgi:DNA-binding NtrC family response regulator